MVAELDGSVWHEKIGAFRLVPYFVQQEINLPGGIEDFVNVARKTLDKLRESSETDKSQPDIWFENVKHVPPDEGDPDNDMDMGEDVLD